VQTIALWFALMSDQEAYRKLQETISILEHAIKYPPIEYSRREIQKKLQYAKQVEIIYRNSLHSH